MSYYVRQLHGGQGTVLGSQVSPSTWVPGIKRFIQHSKSLYQLAPHFFSERIKGQLSIAVNIYAINVKLSGFLCS